MACPHLAENGERAYVGGVKFLATLFGIWAAIIIWIGREGVLGTNPWPVAFLALGPGLMLLFVLFVRDGEK